MEKTASWSENSQDSVCVRALKICHEHEADDGKSYSAEMQVSVGPHSRK